MKSKNDNNSKNYLSIASKLMEDMSKHKLIFFIVCVFTLYSLFLMYEEGLKSQVTFFSNILGIILTSVISISITLYFTDIKLDDSRRTGLINNLYIEEHKEVLATIKFISNMQPYLNKININANDKITYKNNSDSNMEIQKEFLKALGEFNKLEDLYLYPLVMIYSSKLKYDNNSFNEKLYKASKYYNKKFRNDPTFKTMNITNSKIQGVNDIVKKNIFNKLVNIIKSYRNKLDIK